MNHLVVMNALRWLAFVWAALVTLMLVASVLANFLVAGGLAKGLVRLTQLYAGLSFIGYDDETSAALPAAGNAVVIILLYAPAFVLYAFHEHLRKKSEEDCK
jgi:hypothetical protein